jgi:CheY-like chemotaxis protein
MIRFGHVESVVRREHLWCSRRRDFGIGSPSDDTASLLSFAERDADGARVMPAPPSASRGTIVVADDDAATRMLLSQILSQARFTVHACENGQLACDAVVRERPDVILMDWMMPVMDGRAAVQQLKANLDTRGIPIVMLTTQSEIEERVVALEAGVQDFLTKPFDKRELIARIEQQMRWRKMLAVDANSAFAGDRLKLYRPGEEPQPLASGAPASSIFDRIWDAAPKRWERKPAR